MADIADSANDQAALLLSLELKARRREGPKPTGHCLNCFEPFQDITMRWCDSTCRDDYQRREKP